MFLTKQPDHPTVTATPTTNSSALHATIQLSRGQFPYHDHDNIAQMIVSGYTQLQRHQPALKYYCSEHGELAVKVLLPVNIYRLMTSLQTQLVSQTEAALNKIANQLLDNQGIRVVFAPDSKLEQDRVSVVFGISNLLQNASNKPSISISHKNFVLTARPGTNAVALDEYLLSSIDPRLAGRLGSNIVVFEHSGNGKVVVHAPDPIAVTWPDHKQVELFFTPDKRLLLNVSTADFVERSIQKMFLVEPFLAAGTAASPEAVIAPEFGSQATHTEPELSFSALSVDETLPELMLGVAQQQQPQMNIKITLLAVASARINAGPVANLPTKQQWLANNAIQKETGITELAVVSLSKVVKVNGPAINLDHQLFSVIPQGMGMEQRLHIEGDILRAAGTAYLVDGDNLSPLQHAGISLVSPVTLLIGPFIVTLEQSHG
jgi:hypothetical protein